MRRLAVLCGLIVWAALLAHAGDPLDTARKQFEAGDYTRAAGILQAALSKSANDAQLHYWLARCYYELKDFDRAVTSAERAVQLDPQNSLYHQWLGRAYGEKADRDHSFSLARRVRREFETAVRLEPKNLSARRDLVDFLIDAPWIVGGDKSRAWQEAEAIATLDPIEGRLARAAYWFEQKKFDRAEAEYRQVLQAKPQRIEPYYEAADFFIGRQDTADAEAAVEAAARVDPKDRRLAYYRGVVRVLARKHMEEAEQSLKKYLASVPQRSDFPPHATARVWLGRAYEMLGKRQEAAVEYRAALQLDPNHKAAREGLRRVEKSL